MSTELERSFGCGTVCVWAAAVPVIHDRLESASVATASLDDPIDGPAGDSWFGLWKINILPPRVGVMRVVLCHHPAETPTGLTRLSSAQARRRALEAGHGARRAAQFL